MILYVNGDSHTAAAEAVNPHAFAEDDPDLFYMGRAPHPANLAVSWGRLVSDALKTTFRCDAESAASNTRILRTTRQWLETCGRPARDIMIIIQWSTWERQEWLIDGDYYQINASGIDDVPQDHQQRYKEFIAGIDWDQCTKHAHTEIWDLHQEFHRQGIRHVFFNGNMDFSKIPLDQRRDWGSNYLGPYEPAATFNQWLKNHGFDTVAPNSWHFGRDAHAAWSRFMLQYIIDNKLLT